MEADGESVGLESTLSDADLPLDTDVDTSVVPSEVTVELLVGAAMLLFGRKQTTNATRTATEKSETTMASIVLYVWTLLLWILLLLILLLWISCVVLNDCQWSVALVMMMVTQNDNG